MYVECALILPESCVRRSEIANQHRIDLSTCLINLRRSIVHRETILSVAKLAVYPPDVSGYVPFAFRQLEFLKDDSGFGICIVGLLILTGVAKDHGLFVKRERSHQPIVKGLPDRE